MPHTELVLNAGERYVFDMLETCAAPLIQAETLRQLATQRLLQSPPKDGADAEAASDFDLNLHNDLEDFKHQHLQPFIRAAVLIPIIARETPTLLLTERTAQLSAHAGQIAFPGGKIEATDAGPLEAALRETHEEIGLTAAYIDALGFLPPYSTATGFHITPAVALVRPGFTLTPDHAEVADVFEVPLAFLMDVNNHRIHSRIWRGRERHFYAMPYEHRYIWGATAGMIRSLQRRLFEA